MSQLGEMMAQWKNKSEILEVCLGNKMTTLNEKFPLLVEKRQLWGIRRGVCVGGMWLLWKGCEVVTVQTKQTFTQIFHFFHLELSKSYTKISRLPKMETSKMPNFEPQRKILKIKSMHWNHFSPLKSSLAIAVIDFMKLWYVQTLNRLVAQCTYKRLSQWLWIYEC